jgi:biotin carboxyl carrier protein
VTFELATGPRTRRVESRGGQWWLDGRKVDVDAVKVGQRWSLLIGARSYELAFVERGPGDLIVHVNGRAIVVKGGALRFGARRAGPADAASGTAQRQSVRVVAPMPGRITRVLVKAGDTVSARQGLVVVEAMKMENELRAPRAGTVVEVRATAGAPVEANTVLIVIE